MRDKGIFFVHPDNTSATQTHLNHSCFGKYGSGLAELAFASLLSVNQNAESKFMDVPFFETLIVKQFLRHPKSDSAVRGRSPI